MNYILVNWGIFHWIALVIVLLLICVIALWYIKKLKLLGVVVWFMRNKYSWNNQDCAEDAVQWSIRDSGVLPWSLFITLSRSGSESLIFSHVNGSHIQLANCLNIPLVVDYKKHRIFTIRDRRKLR
jgi:hypothetical protein